MLLTSEEFFESQNEEGKNGQRSGLEAAALVFGVELDPAGWMDIDRLTPVTGGGAAGGQAIQETLLKLEFEGLVETRSIGGRGVYRRSAAGLKEAHVVLANDDPQLLPQCTEDAAFGKWTPERGAPGSLEELVGQAAAKHLIGRNLEWGTRLDRVPASMLFYGPSGSGKTLIAGLISRELGVPFVHLSVADLTPSDLDDALDLASCGGVLFLDELQAGARRVRDKLLVALDPGRPTSFLAIAATTDPGSLALPLRRRFQLEVPLDDYSITEAEHLVRTRSVALGLRLDNRVNYSIARVARSNPARIARYVTEAAMLVEGTDTTLSAEQFSDHLKATGRDDRGVDSVELEILVFLRDQCEGPAGLRRIADTVGLDEGIVRERISMLGMEGLIRNRGRQGHELSDAGISYLRGRGF